MTQFSTPFLADACDYACDYGVIGPRAKNPDISQLAIGDKKLAHSAQMFHYQHQKQQIIAMENRNAEHCTNDDENDSDDNENDFTVYGELEVNTCIRAFINIFCYSRMSWLSRMGYAIRHGSEESDVLRRNASH